MTSSVKTYAMSYFDTFIQVAPDCPVRVAVIPVAKGKNRSIAVLEYELLSSEPYSYTQEWLQFSVHALHKAIPTSEQKSRRQELWAEFFIKPLACLRASPLPKKYGWGIHLNRDGKIAIYPVESNQYLEFSKNEGIQQRLALRSQRK